MSETVKKKFAVTKITVRKQASYTKYIADSPNKAQLKELMTGIKKVGNWSLTPKDDRITDAYPTVSGHPGHVDGSDYKMNIERGNGSVDRLFLKLRKYETVPDPDDPSKIGVEISLAAFVERDTH